MPLRSDAKADDAHSSGVRVSPRRSMVTLMWEWRFSNVDSYCAHAQVPHLSPALALLIWISVRAELLVML